MFKQSWFPVVVLIVVLAGHSNAKISISDLNLKAGKTNLQITHDGQSLGISLNCPRFIFNNASSGEGIPPISIEGDIQAGELLTVSFNPIVLNASTSLEVQLLLQWSSKEKIIRKWARYRLTGTPTDLILQEIILDSIDKNILLAEPLVIPPQSFPAFAKGFFMGIEFPVASTRIADQTLILGHKPGLRFQDNQWHESRRAVHGVAVPGRERETFGDYITLHRPRPVGLHINYNSWWSAPATTEDNILALMQQFKDNLTTPYGVSFDSFTIDHGWSKLQSIWEIEKTTFPHEFNEVRKAAQSSSSALGLWSSPSCMYVGAFDTTWAMEQGYETFQSPAIRLSCMGGKRYQKGYAEQLCKIAALYGVKQYKFDGYALSCPESGHGHEPNELSSEALAQGGIDTFEAIHRVSPDAWLETTCFSWGGVGSPWWLFYANSVTGAFGDDAPTGRVPCPIYRESYTTARDYFNLQGASLSPIPISAQEVLGIVHQTTEPFLNDGVITVLRGHSFLPLYVNPVYMDKERWSAMAKLLTWARSNSKILLGNTYPLLPASWLNNQQPKFTHLAQMPREIYGYAHCQKNKGLVAVRNPWIKPETCTLKLDDAIGFNSKASGLSVISLYPEMRVYGQNLNYGNTLTFPVAPYETIVLSIGSKQRLRDIPNVERAIGNQIKTDVTKNDISGSFEIDLQVALDSIATQTQLLVLLEGQAALANPTCQLSVNGKPTEMQFVSSENGWNATGLKEREHWLFVPADLPSKSKISLQLQPCDNCNKVSVWVWATKEGGGMSDYPNALPSPERISLDAVLLGEFRREQAWRPSSF